MSSSITADKRRYHLDELRIALDANDPAHILPLVPPHLEKVLDIGCGAGQTLVAACRNRVSFGLDVDLETLTIGTSIASDVRFVCGRAELLPLSTGMFDMVIARVSLPYSNLAVSLKEIRRVLKKGGRLWMTLHPFSITWRAAKAGGYRERIFFGYIVINSVLFHLVNKQFSFLGKYESFQTEHGIRRALRRFGFHDVSVTRDRHFLVTATAA